MHCANCGTELIAGKRFCHACGARVELRCGECGAPIETGYRFCPDCGSPVPGDDAALPPRPSRPAPAPAPDDRFARLSRHIPDDLAQKILNAKATISGERKLVTVLFCDLVGSTAIAERLDPEEYHELLEQYLEIAFREIYRFEGIVNQLAGDGMMTLFGAPVAHEDAPQRAVGAALAIRDALARFNEAGRAAGRPELRARIGIHTGPVVVGTVGNDLKMDYSAIGDTTNLAARLQSLAEPGTILISESTHRLVRGFFKVEAAGPFDVKGKAEPVPAYAVVRERETATAMTIAEARGLTPLVARDTELAQLEACFERLAGDLPQVVSVVGAAGSGKSRLLYEFKSRVGGREPVFFEATCSALSQSLPYAPFVGMLKRYFGIRGGDAADVAAQKLSQKLAGLGDEASRLTPYLSRMLSLPHDGIGERTAEEIKRETFEAIAHLVMAAAFERPTVMIVEDLHWIDDSSREMLEIAVSKLHHAKFMFLVSHRPDYQPTWRPKVAFTQLNLRRLDDEESRAIVRAVAGGRLPEDLERLVLVKGEGNPFFIEEITRGLVEEGYLLRGGGSVRLTRPVAEVRIPDTVQELIAARLDRLGGAAKRIAQVAAVLGRQFHRQQLRQLLAGEGIDVDPVLEELEERGVIHRKNVLSADEFRFGESLTQEVAYETLLLRERRQLHERVAELLEFGAGAASAEQAALVAHHFVHGENRDKAVEWLLRAALLAEQIPSYRTAAGFYERAWALAEASLPESGAPGDVEAQRRAVEAALGLSRMGVIYGWTDVATTERAARRGRELAERLGNAEAVAGLCLFDGLSIIQSGRERFTEGLRLVEEGLAAAKGARLEGAAVKLSRGVALAYLFDGRLAAAREQNDWALAELDRLSFASRLADVYFGARFLRSYILVFADELDEAERYTLETFDLAAAASNRTSRGGSAAALAWIHFLRGEYVEACEWADRGLELGEAIGNIQAVRTAAAVALGSRMELGAEADVPRHLAQIEQGLTAASDLASRSHLVVDAVLASGEWAHAERCADLAWRYAGGRLREAWAGLALAEVRLRGGAEQHHEARRLAAEALGLAESLGARLLQALAALVLAEIEIAAGDGAESQRLVERALPILRSLRVGRYVARAERLLAEADRTSKRRA